MIKVNEQWVCTCDDFGKGGFGFNIMAASTAGPSSGYSTSKRFLIGLRPLLQLPITGMNFKAWEFHAWQMMVSWAGGVSKRTA